jgi:uncharacterized protein YndB with AHSA1/START domain
MNEAVLVRHIAARPAIVFDALVSEDGIASWWGPDDEPAISAKVDPRVNGAFRVRFRTADGRVHECTGQFLEIDKPSRVVLSWRWAEGGEPDEVEADNVSRVEFRLRPIDTGTELTLIHSALTTEVSATSHEGGWGGALEKLLRQYPDKKKYPHP